MFFIQLKVSRKKLNENQCFQTKYVLILQKILNIIQNIFMVERLAIFLNCFLLFSKHSQNRFPDT